jgi:hypothetical protein
MLLLAILQDSLSVPWDKIISGASGFGVLAIILLFFLKVLPTWKEVRLEDIKARIAQADSMKVVAETLYKVAVEQRRASDTVKVLQHANSRDIDNYLEQLSSVDERLVQIESRISAVPSANVQAA